MKLYEFLPCKKVTFPCDFVLVLQYNTKNIYAKVYSMKLCFTIDLNMYLYNRTTVLYNAYHI